MIFLILALVGVLGIVAMTVMGFVHVGGHGGAVHQLHQGTGHHGLFGHHGHAALPTHTGAQAAHGHVAHANTASSRAAATASREGDIQTSQPAITHVKYHSVLAFIPSPLDLFCFLTGAGLAGMIFQNLVPTSILWIIVVFGAAAFDFVFVKPLFALFLRFASRPTEGLEGAVASTAEVITHFDRKGQGLVRVNLDGQIVQLLARLSPDERERGVRVKKGDQVVVTEVNPTASTCTVTRELSL